MRARSRDVADVASLVERFKERGADESRRREAFDKDWDDRLVAFRKRCDAVEQKLRDRHESSLEKTRVTLELRLSQKPKRFTPQLETLLNKRKELLRQNRFSEVLDALRAAEEREGVEMEEHLKRTRKENIAYLDELFQTQRDELAVFAREREAEESRLASARADAMRRAVKNGFKAYQGVAVEPEIHQSLSEDLEGEKENERDNRNRRRFMGKPSQRNGLKLEGHQGESQSRDVSPLHTTPTKGRTEISMSKQSDAVPSTPSSPATLLQFYENRGGKADVMRLGTAISNLGMDSILGTTSRPGTALRPEMHAPPARLAIHAAALYDAHDASGFVPPGSPIALNSHPYSGVYSFDRQTDDAMNNFMMSDAQRNALAELHARRDASLRLWEQEERAVLASSGLMSDAPGQMPGQMHQRGYGAHVPSHSQSTSRPVSSMSAHFGVPNIQNALTVSLTQLHRQTASSGVVTFAKEPSNGNGLDNSNNAVRLTRPPFLRNRANDNRSPSFGPPVAEARAAADDLHAAAISMTQPSLKRADQSESAAVRRKREEAAAFAEEAAERRRTLRGDDSNTMVYNGHLSDDDSSIASDELDDLCLASPRASNTSGSININLGSVSGTFVEEPLLAPRGTGVVVGHTGRSTVMRDGLKLSNAGNSMDLPNHSGQITHRFGSGSRGVAPKQVADSQNDSIRDFPLGSVARGANILKRMPGPDDCYRNRRMGEGVDAGVGELGFPNRDEDLRDAPVVLKKETTEAIDAKKTDDRRIVDDDGSQPLRDAPQTQRTGLRGLRSSTVPPLNTQSSEKAAAAQNAAVAAARLAAFKYGQVIAPTTSVHGEPIGGMRRLNAHIREGSTMDVTSNVTPGVTPTSNTYVRHRAPPVGHHVDSATGLKMSDVEITKAVQRDGLSKGEVIIEPEKLSPSEKRRAHRLGIYGGIHDGSPVYGGMSTTALQMRRSDADITHAPPTPEELKLLFKHVRKGEYDGVKVLFKKRNVDINVRDGFGNTLLIVACQNGAGRVAKLCLKKGADVNCVNGKKCSALHFALSFGFEKLADWLVEHGADKRAVNDNGKTPYEGL